MNGGPAKISEGRASPARGPFVIWRVAPADYVIRSESPGNRERRARFRPIREWSAKFDHGTGPIRLPSLIEDNLTPGSG
jgi:hypothetical protein